MSENEDDEPNENSLAELEKKHQIEKAKQQQSAAREAKIELIKQQLSEIEAETEFKLLTADSLASVDMRSFLLK